MIRQKPNRPKLNTALASKLRVISAYPMTEPGGNPVRDIMKRYDGSMVNFSPMTRRGTDRGLTLDFTNSVTEYVHLANTAILDYTKPFTIAGVACATSTAESHVFCMSRLSSNSPFVRVLTLNNLLYFGARNDTEAFESYNSSASITSNIWFTYVCVREANNLIVYLNGRRYSSAISVPTTGITLDRTAIGAFVRPLMLYSNGYQATLVLAQKAWCVGEALEYTKDPYALFKGEHHPMSGIAEATVNNYIPNKMYYYRRRRG